MNLAADHDHDQAAGHDHPDDVACEDCMRGFLCSSCNRDILGMLRGRMGSDEAARMVLINLHNYLGDPPAQRVQRRRFYSQQEDERESAAMWHVHGITG